MSSSKANYNDVYVPRDGIGTGRLIISGKNTELKLTTSNRCESADKSIGDHHGTLNDGSKASLLRCFPTRVARYGLGDKAQHETALFPHYVLIGGSFISSEDAIIRSIHYHFENAECIANGVHTFGTIYPDQEEFSRILKADYERLEGSAREHEREGQELAPKSGDVPILQYYSGVYEIVRCGAEIGSVTLGNRASHGLGDSRGVRIDNEVTVSLEFARAKTVGEALSSLRVVHDFFELCLGRRQRHLWIEVELEEAGVERDDPHSPTLEMYWSYGNADVSGETESTLPLDVLLDAERQKAQFARVLSNWLDSADSMGSARSRIANSFHSGFYGTDRIVGSANAFDLLPDTHVPARLEVDSRTREALRECRERFRALPESFARQSVLSALGRVGTPSLRDKICHRAEIVAEADPRMFTELRFVCTQAVLCRNHFVHGSEGAFDYRKEFGAFVFLADTLEFVFAASDLIELGWEYRLWREKGTTQSHRFGSYLVGYEMNLRRLKELNKG